MTSTTTGQLFSSEPKRPPILNKQSYARISNVKAKKCSFPFVAVTTTIKSSTKCITSTAEHLPVIVVGDVSSLQWSPPKSVENNTIFLSIKLQNKLFPTFSSMLPTKSFARKNLGYVYAVSKLNACIIYDFDDDNCPTNETIELFKQISSTRMPKPELLLSISNKTNFINPYILYGSEEFIWPRGFAFQELGLRDYPIVRQIEPKESLSVEVIQIMQNIDPDVDSIWRLLNAHKQLPMIWKSDEIFHSKIAALDKFKYSPFNAQSVLLTSLATSIGYMPFTVNSRVSDIWRSFIIQYFLHHINSKGNIAFTGHFVNHFRNSHNYLADYDAEKQLFDQSSSLVNYLASRPLSHPHPNFACEFIKLMEDLYVRGFIEKEDVFASLEWVKLMPMSESLTNREPSDQVEKPKLNATLFIGTTLNKIPLAKSVYKDVYETVIPIELYVDECHGKMDGETILCLPSFDRENIERFVSKNYKYLISTSTIIFATFGRKLPSDKIIQNKQFIILNRTARYFTNDFLIIQQHSSFDKQDLMNTFNYKNDIIKYCDPYECVNKTLLYLMIKSNRLQHYEKEYFPSLLLYFPIKYTLGHTFSLDNTQAEHNFLHVLNKSYQHYFGSDFKVHGSFFNDYNKFYWRFYVDYIHLLPFVNADDFEAHFGQKPMFIAISDVDTMFQTPIAPSDLFDDQGRPVIIGRLVTQQKDVDKFWTPMTAATAEILRKEETMRCMTYFPVIFKTEHFRNFVEHVESVHGMPFYEYILNLHKRKMAFDQFGLMCNYVWNYHRDEYDWHLQRSSVNFNVNPPKGSISKEKLREITEYTDLTHPFARVAQHFKYSKFTKSQKLFNHITYCLTCNETNSCKNLGKYNTLANCSRINMGTAFDMFFEFEGYMGWLYDPEINQSYRKHFDNVREMIKRNYWSFNTTILDYMIQIGVF